MVCRLALVLSLFLSLAACRTAAPPADASLTVTGTFVMRGNEPFAEPVLETDDQAFYVLVFPDEEGMPLQAMGRYRVTGEVYSDTWQGQPFAHLRVEDWETAE